MALLPRGDAISTSYMLSVFFVNNRVYTCLVRVIWIGFMLIGPDSDTDSDFDSDSDLDMDSRIDQLVSWLLIKSVTILWDANITSQS